MIYTFLFGIWATFNITKSFLFETTAYFFTFIISILGWSFLGKNKSLLKSYLGFIFLPAFPLFNTLYSFASYYRRVHIEKFIKFGCIYLTVLVISLVIIIFISRKKDFNKDGIQFIFIVLSGLMISIHSCIELITNFENIKNWEFFYLSIILIIVYYLLVIKIRFCFGNIKKSNVLYLISSILFWIYIIFYDFISFAHAAGGV